MISVEENIPLKKYCTWGVGGPARYFVTVRSVEEAQAAFGWVKEKDVPFFILGKGSNCLFDDCGFDGVVIDNRIDICEWISETTVKVGAGYNFSLLGTQSARKGLSGLEFASGIPGSVGGAVYMNAGANGRETCDTLVSVEYLDFHKGLKTYSREELEFSYRSSPFQNRLGSILSATFSLKEKSEARSDQKKIIEYRKKTQPLTEKTAGCVFRNPDGGHSGALIEQCQLKGYRIGGAFVSSMHANFVVNDGTATAKDICTLIEEVQKRVEKQTGYNLKVEVRFIPHRWTDGF